MSDLYVGIDLSVARRKRVPIVVAREQDKALVPLPRNLPSCIKPPTGPGNPWLAREEPLTDYTNGIIEVLREFEQHYGGQVACIAIDTPRAMARQGTRRVCDEEVAKEGRSLISVPDDFIQRLAAARAWLDDPGNTKGMPYSNQLWMLAGFELFEALENAYPRVTLREVYPYAAFMRLDDSLGVKHSPEGIDGRIALLAGYTGFPDSTTLKAKVRNAGYGSLHDKVDAFLCAALAWKADPNDAYGSGVECIWMPPHPVVAQR